MHQHKRLFSPGYNRTNRTNPGGLLSKAYRDTITMPTASRARVISPLVGEAMAQEAVELRIEEFREKGEEIPTGKDS